MRAIPQKSMETQISLPSAETLSTFDYRVQNNCSNKINSTVFPNYLALSLLPEIAPPAVNSPKSEFTFSLTKPHQLLPA